MAANAGTRAQPPKMNGCHGKLSWLQMQGHVPSPKTEWLSWQAVMAANAGTRAQPPKMNGCHGKHGCM
eukprot:1162137-Pelagomonas_calceolata.AAC.2